MIRNASEGVIGISGRNPHYFSYKGKEILLIASAEHYGAVINTQFDYLPYLDRLAEYGCNYTRIYPGALLEKAGSWAEEDILAPGNDVIVPWARSDEDGYICGGKKFDLSRWDPDYFTRLRDFIAQAEKRGIIVEICFFNAQSDASWSYSPLYYGNNIQQVGNCPPDTFQSLDNEPLLITQLVYVNKLIQETNEYGNVIYEFCDEPTIGLGNSRKAYEWIDRLVDYAIIVEDQLPRKHLLAQQLEYGVNFADDDRTGLIVTQYVTTRNRQVGSMDGLNNMYYCNKPIELNETAYIPNWIPQESEELKIALSRLESWEFIVGGGAGFNQLNGYFVPSNPSGDDATNLKLLQNLRNLRTFVEGFDYVRMIRDFGTVKNSDIGASVSAMFEKGKQYALYMHHSFPTYTSTFGFGTWYWPSFGDYHTVLTIGIEKGRYKLTFIEPETLTVLEERDLVSTGKTMEITCPRYHLDIAIKITVI